MTNFIIYLLTYFLLTVVVKMIIWYNCS